MSCIADSPRRSRCPIRDKMLLLQQYRILAIDCNGDSLRTGTIGFECNVPMQQNRSGYRHEKPYT